MKVTYWVFDLGALDEGLRQYAQTCKLPPDPCRLDRLRSTFYTVLQSEALAPLRIEREIAEPELPSPLRHMPRRAP